MINVSKIAAYWPKDNSGWSIAPIGIDWLTAGNRVKLGDGVTEAHDLGVANGFRIALASIEGAAFIGGSCKFMSIAEALEYVSGRPDRSEVLERIRFAETMAKRLGWSIGAVNTDGKAA